jgi:predicted nuclease with TOPRIM domain
MKKLQIFLANPSLLSEPEYLVRSNVDPPVFIDFVKFIKGESIEITASNFGGLSALCLEFGFKDLSSDLSSFKDLHPEAVLKNHDVINRLCDHEKHIAELAQDVCEIRSENAHFARALRRKEKKVAVLARRLEAQKNEIARPYDEEVYGRVLMMEEQFSSQEVLLEAGVADVLELKNAVEAIRSTVLALLNRSQESEASLVDLRSSLAVVERENARLASELAGVAIDVRSVRELQESETS